MLLGKFDGAMNFKRFFTVIGDKTAYQANAVFIWHFKFLSCFQPAKDFLTEFFSMVLIASFSWAFQSAGALP